ncbi:StsA-related sactipeptide RiPP [Actinoplanes sp. NPDC020271]|uniref:StsA-related sactipeptide RiPP n=1 Tax=Actinoplanes sp. NPDC020271 TaxID=3363896 RepID=UPI0037A7F60B
MAFNAADALREAGILSGPMTPEVEEFFSTLSESETQVLISTRNRLAAVLPDVVAHSATWAKPEASEQDFDAAMLCMCGAWSGSGNAQN